MYYILDENRNPVKVELLEAAEWLEKNNRQVRRTDFKEDDIFVSTVFLGIDHRYGDGPPILWETMIFGGEHDHEYQMRYTSEADAIKGHEKACDLVREEVGINQVSREEFFELLKKL